MSDDTEEREGDEALLKLLADTLTADGELLPTDEAEVARAEADVDDVALPGPLLALTEDEADAEREGPRSATDLAAYRKAKEEEAQRISPWISHGISGVLGAAAAAALLLLQAPDPPPIGGGPTAEPTPTGTAVPSAETIALSLDEACEACCGGEACGTPKDDMKTCASGRRCVPCDPDTLEPTLYRLRIGAVKPDLLGEDTLRAFPQGKPEICVRVGATGETCVDTSIAQRSYEPWNVLPPVVSSDDLSARLSLRLRWKGVAEPKATAATWAMAVGTTPSALCKGYRVQLKNADGEVFGRLSLFIDDAHHLEVARAAEPGTLRELASRFSVKGLTLSIHETEREDNARFVLGAGPFDKPTAEGLRWQLLEQKQPATVALGLDYVGAPMKLP